MNAPNAAAALLAGLWVSMAERVEDATAGGGDMLITGDAGRLIATALRFAADAADPPVVPKGVVVLDFPPEEEAAPEEKKPKSDRPRGRPRKAVAVSASPLPPSSGVRLHCDAHDFSTFGPAGLSAVIWCPQCCAAAESGAVAAAAYEAELLIAGAAS